ncbi:hypothetical protein [Intrasporangium sp.]|uniref:hypothetical protein n=1 Tax=Intrasporangium sp. TaxID=1925024 RepID=UPI0032215CED
MSQEYLTFSDLQGLQSSPDAVRQAFDKQFGKRPDGLALNDSTYYNAVQPPITQQYGHFCYKSVTDYQFGPSQADPPHDAIVGSNTAKNNGDTEAEISLSVTGTWTEETGWSSSVTTGLTYSEEFTLEGVFKMGMSFSVAVTAGKSGSSSVSKSSSASVTVKVPPRSQVTVSMIATMKKEKMPFLAPIRVSGMFGANFPERVNGHYFWFSGADVLLPRTQGEITGVIEGTAAFDVHTDIGPATPISD